MFQNVLTLVSLRKPAASTHLAHGLETPSTIPLVAKAAKAHKQTHASFSRAASSSRFASISAWKGNQCNVVKACESNS